jgi:4-amino-4-deoxy-L-arabinose transferase-like glycosyltransferase
MIAAVKPRHFWIGSAVALHLFFSLVYLDLPGLQYDELLFVNAAMGNVDGTFVAWQVQILGKKLPIMLMEYIGALKALLYAPIFKLFGMSPATVCLPVILIGLITLLVTYAFVQRIFGRWVAVITLLLLATDPTFIFSNKLDWGPVSLMIKVCSIGPGTHELKLAPAVEGQAVNLDYFYLCEGEHWLDTK